MDTKSALIKIMKCGRTNSEKEVNTFFLNLKLNFIDCDAKIRKKGEKKDLGEIDGIFQYEDRFLFLIEVDESSEVDTKKQDAFFSKWSDKVNQKIILEKYNLLNNLEITKIFICFNELRSVSSSKPSIQHQIKDPTNALLFKEDVDYFFNSYKILGPWAKNDLFSFLGLKNKKLSEEIDALRLIVGNEKAYLCTRTALELLESCYISRRIDSTNQGYQRIIKANRINTIGRDIEQSKILAFPNAIILNTEQTLDKTYSTKRGYCKIDFPNDFCSNRVIDGQHRLLGFSKVSENKQKEHTLAVVIFENLGKEKEIRTFIDINNTQKKIDPNLLLVLKSDFSWPAKSKFYDDTKIVNIIIDLSKKNSLLKDKVFFGYNEPRKNKMTLTTLVGAIRKNNLVGGKLHLLENTINKLDHIEELNLIFNAMKSEFKDHVDINKKGFFVSNKGIRIIFRLIQFFIRNKNRKKVDENLNYNNFFNDINSLINPDYLDNLEKYYGEGGALKACEKIIRDLKSKHNQRYKKFSKSLKGIK